MSNLLSDKEWFEACISALKQLPEFSASVSFFEKRGYGNSIDWAVAESVFKFLYDNNQAVYEWSETEWDESYAVRCSGWSKGLMDQLKDGEMLCMDAQLKVVCPLCGEWWTVESECEIMFNVGENGWAVWEDDPYKREVEAGLMLNFLKGEEILPKEEE